MSTIDTVVNTKGNSETKWKYKRPKGRKKEQKWMNLLGRSMLGNPSLPEVFVSLGVPRGKFDVLRESSLRKLEHALVEKVWVGGFQRRKNAENVGRRDTSVGHLAFQEDTLAKGGICVNVDVFLVLGMGASS